MNFIRLTESGTGNEFFVNMDVVLTIWPQSTGGSRLWFAGENNVEDVRESAASIISAAQGGMPLRSAKS